MGRLCQTAFRRTRARCSLDYVGRYTHRVALSNHRLLDMENGQVRFLWKDYRDAQQKTLTLSANEFVRRFLIHVPPDRFQRIRYYGFMGYRDRFEQLTGNSLRQCPACPSGHMRVVEVLSPIGKSPAPFDTS